MRHAVSSLLLLSLVPMALGEDDPSPRRQALEHYQEAILSQREVIHLGQLEVTVILVPDYFNYLAISQLLESENLDERSADSLRAQLERLAKSKSKTRGKMGVVITLHHEEARGDNFFAFEGKLNDCVQARALGKTRLTPVSSSGGMPEQRQFRLFKASRSGLFSGNVPPTMRRTYNVLQAEPLTLHMVVKKAPSDRADELQISVGNLIHFNGSGIRGNQMDFQRGANGKYETGEAARFALPLEGPELPKVLEELLPASE